MLRKSDIIQRRDTARKQFMEDEDYDKWTGALAQLYDEALPGGLIPVRDNMYVPMLNKLRHVIYEGHPKDIEVYKADKVIQQGKVPADDESLWTMAEPFEFNDRAVENPSYLEYSDGNYMPYIKGKAYPYSNGADFLNELTTRKPKALKYLKSIHDAGYDVSEILEEAQRLSGNDMSDIKASLDDNVPPHKRSYPDDTIVYRSIDSYPYKMQDKDIQSLKGLLSNKDKFAFDEDYDTLTNAAASENSDIASYLKKFAVADDEDLPPDMQDMLNKYRNGEISEDEYHKAANPYSSVNHMFKYNIRDEDAVNDILSRYASDSIKVAPDGMHSLPYGSPHLEDYIPLFLTDSDDPDDTQKNINDTLTDGRF